MAFDFWMQCEHSLFLLGISLLFNEFQSWKCGFSPYIIKGKSVFLCVLNKVPDVLCGFFIVILRWNYIEANILFDLCR